MELNQFETEIRNELSKFAFVKDIEIARKTEISLKILVFLENKYQLSNKI